MPVVAMLLAILGLSSAIIGNKVLLTELTVAEATSARYGIAALLLLAVVALRRELWSLRRVGRWPLVMGLLEPGTVGLTMSWGLVYTTATHAAIFWAIVPAVMPLLGRLAFHEPIRPSVLVGAVLALAGTAILISGSATGGAGSLFGDALCLFAVATACANQLIARKVATSGGRPAATTTVQIAVGTSVALVALLVTQGGTNLASLDLGGNSLVLYLAIAGTALPFLLYNYAIRHLPVGRVSLFPPLTGPVGAGLAAIFLGEPISVSVVSAVALVLFGVLLPSLTGYMTKGAAVS